MTPIDTEYKRLCALRDATPQAPWEVGTKSSGTQHYIYCDNALGTAVATVKFEPDFTGWSDEQRAAIAAFIAAAHDAMRLCDRLMAERAEWVGDVKKLRLLKPPSNLWGVGYNAALRDLLAKLENGS